MSNLLVQNIKHTNGTTAQTIDSSGRNNSYKTCKFCVFKQGINVKQTSRMDSVPGRLK